MTTNPVICLNDLTREEELQYLWKGTVPARLQRGYRGKQHRERILRKHIAEFDRHAAVMEATDNLAYRRYIQRRTRAGRKCSA